MADDVEQALAIGDWATAAELLGQRGEHARAAALFERLLEFSQAALAHLRAGDALAALNAVARGGRRSGDPTVVEEIRRTAPAPVLQQGARAMEEAARPDLAAPLYDAAGDLESAARAYEAAGNLPVAARRLLATGNARAAGVLLERHLVGSPGDPQAQLELGTILARFGKHDAATPLLRSAAASQDHAVSALRRLAVSFWMQGHPHAAERALEDLALVDAGSSRDVLALAAVEGLQSGPQREGTRIDRRYLVLAPRSASSLGDTYLAHDEFGDRRVALTLFRPAVAQSPVLRRFATVCHAAAQVDLPQLLPVFEFNVAGGFLATAVPEGAVLDDWLRRGGVPDADGVVRAAGRVLEALHRRGLVHGALNASNIHVSEAGGVQLSEVGAGLLLALRETESVGLETSLATLAPEVVGGAAPGPAADQYALGAIAFRLVNGRWPSMSGPPRAAADDPLATAIHRALQPRPDQRHASLAAFLDALPRIPSVSLPPGPVHAPAWVNPDTRLRAVGPPETTGSVTWTPHRDLLLDRDVAVVEGPDGSLLALRTVAALTRGVQAVLDIAADGRRAVLERLGTGPWPPPPALALLLADAADALAHLHDHALVLGPGREARMVAGRTPLLALEGLPLPSGGPPAERAADVAWLADLARALVPGLGILPAGTAAELAGALRAWEREFRVAPAVERNASRSAEVEALLHRVRP